MNIIWALQRLRLTSYNQRENIKGEGFKREFYKSGIFSILSQIKLIIIFQDNVAHDKGSFFFLISLMKDSLGGKK